MIENEIAFDLTPMQQNMVLRSLVAPCEGHYVQQLRCRLSVTVEPEAFVRAWSLLAARHEILRASFATDASGALRQYFSATLTPVVEVRDQQGVPPQHWPGVLEKFLTEDRTSGFELGLAPLWRVTLFQWDADASEFVWTFHHALLDGRAHSLLLEELCRLYEALRTGRATTNKADHNHGVPQLQRAAA